MCVGLEGGVMVFTLSKAAIRHQAKTSRETWSATEVALGQGQKMGN